MHAADQLDFVVGTPAILAVSLWERRPCQAECDVFMRTDVEADMQTKQHYIKRKKYDLTFHSDFFFPGNGG